MSKIIGIDLGSSNSCVSVIENGVTTVIPNSEGKRTTPSIVSFNNGDIKIGEPAKRQAVTNPKNTIYTVKRLMGKTYDQVKDMNLPYNVVNNNGKAAIDIDGKIYTPEEISAMILQKMKQTAEDFLGEKVDRCIITVPANFDDAERNATISAGKIAGMEVERVINEPTSAALAYGVDDGTDKTIAVVDFGGSTQDFSILELGDGVFEVLKSKGDLFLGGDEVDNKIIDWLVDEFKSETGIDASKDPMALQRLREAAERAKIELSSTTSTDINLPYLSTSVDGGPKHLVKTLSRSKFDQMIVDIVEKVMKPCKEAMKNAKLKPSDIDEVLLVGGSTRIPAIRTAIKDFFKKDLNNSVNPDESVSIGAGTLGGVLMGDVTDVLLLDVTSISLGIETMGGVFTKMIDANTTIPTTKTQIYSTASDNQPSVQINIAQGERTLFKDNKHLGMFSLDMPPAPRGIPQIEVSMDVDVNGVLKVKAVDKASGKEKDITIKGSTGLSEEEIERMKNDAEVNMEKDKKIKEQIDLLNQTDSLIFQTEKSLKEMSEKLSDEDVTLLTDNLNSLKKSYESKDFDMIEKDTEILNNSWGIVNEKMSSSDDQPPTEDVGEEVDFEEVN